MFEEGVIIRYVFKFGVAQFALLLPFAEDVFDLFDLRVERLLVESFRL